MPSQRILLATFGSLGDLHPYIALAQSLQQRGHTPVLATTDRYHAAVEAAGVEFAAMRPGEAELPDMDALMPKLFDPSRGPEYLVRTLIMAHVRGQHADLSRLAADADLLITHPLAVTGPLIAEQTGIPWASSVLAPMSLLSAYDPPLFPPAPWMRSVRKLGVAPYRALFGLMKLVSRSWEAPLRELRAELGLPPARKQALFEGQYSPGLNLALFSPLLAEPQADWPANTHLCGFARYDGASPDAATQQRLDRFLAAGDPPLVFALGSSAVMIAGDFWDKAIAAARALGRRAILITARQDRDIDENIAEFAYLPYSAVFPHAAANIHQAGIGTLSQALAAGRPQLIVPVSFDQPDNAARTARLGVARVLPFQKVSVEGLKRELQALLSDAAYARRAADIGARVGSENGGTRAAALIEAFGDHRLKS
jgi:UDP:flavonoid glycosyltransferase YjiC (YdhE family)